jgi:hypothetical protein
MNPKILIIAPTSLNKDYIFIEWYLHISTLTYQNYDIVICDNSIDETYYKNLQKMGINCLYVSPKNKSNAQYITESQNLLRNYFLNHKEYDIMISIEVDVFPPRNFIEKLLSTKKEVVSGLYFWNFGKNSKPLVSYFVKTGEKKMENVIPGMFDCFKFVDSEVKQIYQTGIGCTMIYRKIVEKIKFRTDNKKFIHSDVNFYKDLYNFRIPNYMDTSIICKHYNSDWSLISDV